MTTKNTFGITVSVCESCEGGYVGWRFIDKIWMFFQADSMTAMQVNISTGLLESTINGSLDPIRYSNGIIEIQWVKDPPCSYGVYHKNPFELADDPRREQFYEQIAINDSFILAYNVYPDGQRVLAPRGRFKPELHYQFFKRVQDLAIEPRATTKSNSFEVISRAWHQAMRQ